MNNLDQHFFRHEYGNLVAMLSRRVGVQHLEAIEDAVQSALMSAVQPRGTSATIENPSAWLYQIAHNFLISELRATNRHRHLLERYAIESSTLEHDEPPLYLPGEVGDDLLRMLFICCDTNIPYESQATLALKTLCGFSIKEIALRLFVSEANVYKRLARARSYLKRTTSTPLILKAEQIRSRVPAVNRVIYILFTEGFLSSHRDNAIRNELCHEAIRLARILADHPFGSPPSTSALIALLYLHLARSSARQDASGGLLLLEEQDRCLWDQSLIQKGITWLKKSASGDQFSRYHGEAIIAAEHCLSPSIEETRWEKIVECYTLLENIAPSPLHLLNRAVAIAQWQGPTAGLTILEEYSPPRWLQNSYLWSTVLADLYRRSNDRKTAQHYLQQAIKSAPSEAVRTLINRRFSGLHTNKKVKI